MATLSRRHFIEQGLVGAGVLASGRLALGAASTADEVNLGIIGCGWRGGQLLDAFARVPGVRIGALCDPDQARTEELAKKAEAAEQHTDLRRLLDIDAIDAVAVATCNHWHCLAAIWALQAGKHVYVEKPLFHNRWEGQQLLAAVNEHDKICQIGTQQRSDPMQAEIKRFLHEDATIGAPLSVHVNRIGVRGPIGRRDQPLRIPESVDYDLWLGPADEQPIYRDKLHYDWHWVWNTGSGEMGNWGVHIIDDVRNNVFQDKIDSPRRATAAGGRYIWDDAGNTPNVQLAVLDTRDVPVSIGLCNLPAGPDTNKAPECSGPNSGYIVSCEGGRLEGQRGRAVAYDQDGKEIRRFNGDGGRAHQRNFIECVRDEDASKLNGSVEEGFHSTWWCEIANIATRVAGDHSAADSHAEMGGAISSPHVTETAETFKELLVGYGADQVAADFRLGPTLQFDAEQQRFVGESGEAASALLRRQGRAKFKL